MSRLALALSLAVTGAVVSLPNVADACGNTVRRLVDSGQEYVQRAELLLAKAQYRKAVSTIREAFGDKAIAAHMKGPGAHLHGRAQRIVALAVARSGGAVAIGMDLGGAAQSRKDAAIAWAVLALRLQAGDQPTPAQTAELAEALARQTSGRAEAYDLLKGLGDGDLMPTAQGWALLAELSKERGDVEGSKTAVERCVKMRARGVKCELTEQA
ncbi:hypothetical protein SAMN02745121_04673 [Nannocystis exedens]|uniref:Tetratricopeptide repeat-containing protein n=1 Tax=Nannocystis exedens TaxID=54 RepID=A0A1I2BGN7_9BACT|nr:hypothetical protein [Nannocystis exedens]PCC67984.1 hypothetical protein NAEX_00992 [Nannocystis exedens]SFE55335.1 hypothetical protein SAMN02745121_04673 [Nannocystis exedens]